MWDPPSQSSTATSSSPPYLLLSALASRGPSASPVTVRGWVRSVRSSKAVSFVVLNDGSAQHSLQLVLTPEQAKHITIGSSIQAIGCIHLIPRTPSPASSSSLPSPTPSLRSLELHPTSLTVLGPSPSSYPISKHHLTLEYLREHAHLRHRTSTLSALARIRSAAFHAFHSFLTSHSFTHVHTPIITPLDCEGGGEAFTLSAPSDRPPSLFFTSPAFLTVSGQLYAEMMAAALTRVYAFGPTFRAETSATPRHLAEFWMLEPEVSWCGLEGVMELSEGMVKEVTRRVMRECGEEMEWLEEREVKEGGGEEGAGGVRGKKLRERLRLVVDEPWHRMSYTEAVDALQRSGRSFDFPVRWGEDLHSEHERWLADVHCQRSADWRASHSCPPFHSALHLCPALTFHRVLHVCAVCCCAGRSSSPTTLAS